uniref:Uncharacterized protein n=1 Tax=Anas zonorhyncha TaxID=75864 RepID=A0A8B9TYG2_9AVES
GSSPGCRSRTCPRRRSRCPRAASARGPGRAHPPEPAYRRKPNPVRRFDGDVLSPSYIQSFRERQTGPSLTSLMASSHAVVDLDYDCSSTVPLTTGSSPAVRV